MRIHIAESVSPEVRATLLDHAADDELSFADDQGNMSGTLADAQIAFGNPSPSSLLEATKLRWLQLASVGFEEYVGLEWAQSRPPLITNLGDTSADQVAQTALAGLLALTRAVDVAVRLKELRVWGKDQIRATARTLERPRVLCLGYGASNRRLAELLLPFKPEMRVVTSRSTDLDEILPWANIISCALPETPKTVRILDGRRLRMLNPTAIIINIGRGSAIEEGALVAGLRDGSIGGAVLDVTEQEPIAHDDPVWTTPNLILTQHSAGGASDEMARKIEVFKRNLDAFRSGADLENIVNLSRGY